MGVLMLEKIYFERKNYQGRLRLINIFIHRERLKLYVGMWLATHIQTPLPRGLRLCLYGVLYEFDLSVRFTTMFGHRISVGHPIA